MNRIFSSPRLISLLLALSAPSVTHANEFTVTTESQQNGRFPAAQFANTFGCTGANQSPQIRWRGAPAAAKSFVITMYDPGAPTGSGWWHWVLANVPATVSELPAGAGSEPNKLPAGTITVTNDYGVVGYGGLCPPKGRTHRYVITVHALNVEQLTLPANASPALTGFMAWVHGIDKASVTILAGR